MHELAMKSKRELERKLLNSNYKLQNLDQVKEVSSQGSDQVRLKRNKNNSFFSHENIRQQQELQHKK